MFTLLRALAALLVAAALAGCTSAIATPTFPPPDPPAAVDLVVVTGELADFLRAHARRVVVERVLDGDTITVTGDERVRLLTINAPELHATTRADDADCGAQAAADALSALLPPGTPVLLNGLKGEPPTDRYGRTLSRVFLDRPGGLVNISLYLAEGGLVRVYTEYPTADSDDASQLADAARSAKRGLWGACS